MHKVSQKKNISSLQVLKTLQILLDGNYSMKDLIKILNKNEPNEIFNNSVISKYINTCRYVGINIPKINNKYYVASLPFGLDLSDIDFKLLRNFQFIIQKNMASKNLSIFNKFSEKISRYSNKEIVRVEKEIFSIPLELFERAVSKKRKIKLIFKNRSELECIPVNITQKDNKTFFNVYKKNKVRNIESSRLCGIRLLEDNFIDPFDGNQITVYILKGDLAKRYEARDNETIQQNNDGTITVTNKNENKDLLLSRILRYQDLCEIIQPKAYREELKQIINDTLNNYGV